MQPLKLLLNSRLPFPVRRHLSGLNLVERPLGKSIMILAPHMDDEIIGCGGTLCKHMAACDNVCVVYFTCDTAERKKEAQKAAAVTGIKELCFLDCKEGCLEGSREAVALLDDIITRYKPDLLYVPHFTEEHPDHRATLDMGLEACRRLCPVIIGYEIWNPLVPNFLVDISAFAEQKNRALSCYQSQLTLHNIQNLSNALNQYRAAFLKFAKYKYAEAFFAAPWQEYITLTKQYRIFYNSFLGI